MSGPVLIVGGGVVGLSTAWWLAERGVELTIVEKGAVPDPRAASADHHRLIRFAYAEAGGAGYAGRIRDAFGAWRAIWAALPGGEGRYYIDRGVLAVSLGSGDWADRARLAMDEAGISYERIDGTEAVSERFPVLAMERIAYAMMTEGGALMANRILWALAEALRMRGVRILEHSPVVAVEQGIVRLAQGRMLEAETIIVSAGTGTPGLLPALRNTLRARRSLILYADPPEEQAEAWSEMPCWVDLGGEDDHWGISPVEGLPAKLGLGALGRLAEDDDDRVFTADEQARMLAAYASRFRDMDRWTVRWAQANQWTEAPEHRFFIRREGAVLAVSACSGHGFKFGALSGRDVADAVTGAVPFETVRALMAGEGIPA